MSTGTGTSIAVVGEAPRDEFVVNGPGLFKRFQGLCQETPFAKRKSCLITRIPKSLPILDAPGPICMQLAVGLPRCVGVLPSFHGVARARGSLGPAKLHLGLDAPCELLAASNRRQLCEHLF